MLGVVSWNSVCRPRFAETDKLSPYLPLLPSSLFLSDLLAVDGVFHLCFHNLLLLLLLPPLPSLTRSFCASSSFHLWPSFNVMNG